MQRRLYKFSQIGLNNLICTGLNLMDVSHPLNLIVDSAIPPYPFNERQVMNKANLYGS